MEGKILQKDIEGVLMHSINEDLEPCPRCKSKDVDWTNSRDLDLLISCVRCGNCDLITFEVTTMAFMDLPNADYETTKMKYNAWCKTNPTRYYDEDWN